MNIEIDTELNNWILTIPEHERITIVNRYLKLGYITGTLCQTTVNPMNNIFDPIKTKLDTISNNNSSDLNLISAKINENLDRVKNSIEHLSANNYKSVLKGQYGENLVENIIDQNFPDYSIVDTTKKDSASDYQLITNLGDRILIEVKNYSNVVPTTEVTKFIKDISQSSSKVGLFISLNSGISNRRRFAIENIDGKKIIFIPKSGIDGASIIWGLLLGIELINSESKYNNLTENKLMDIYNDFEKILNGHYNLINSIKETKDKIEKSLNGLYTTVVEQDINIQKTFADVKCKIRDELNCTNTKLVDNDYNFYEKILFELKEHKDVRYSIFYELLEICKDKNKKIRVDETAQLNWEIYDDTGKIVCNIKTNKRKVDMIYNDNIITLNNMDIIKMLIKD